MRSGVINIAIMQSLFEGEEKDVKPFVAEYGMDLCDECHHVAAFTVGRSCPPPPFRLTVLRSVIFSVLPL